jgi:hypothetical protein
MSVGLRESVVSPLLTAIDDEVARRTKEILAEQARLQAALEAAEARAEQAAAAAAAAVAAAAAAAESNEGGGGGGGGGVGGSEWPDDPMEIFSKLDSNGDGQLDRSEILALLVLLGYEPAEVTAEYVNGIFDEFSSDPPMVLSAAGIGERGERGIRPEEFVRMWKFLRGEGDGSEGDGGAAGGGGGGGEQADAEGTADSSPAPDGPSAQDDDDGAEEDDDDEEDEEEDGMYYITAPDGNGSGGEGSPSEEVSFAEIIRLHGIGAITNQTMVFTEGMEGWAMYSDPAVQEIIAQRQQQQQQQQQHTDQRP